MSVLMKVVCSILLLLLLNSCIIDNSQSLDKVWLGLNNTMDEEVIVQSSSIDMSKNYKRFDGIIAPHTQVLLCFQISDSLCIDTFLYKEKRFEHLHSYVFKRTEFSSHNDTLYIDF